MKSCEMRIFLVVNCSGVRFLKKTNPTIHRINLPFITSRLLGTFVDQTDLSTSLELSHLKNVHAVTSANHEGSHIDSNQSDGNYMLSYLYCTPVGKFLTAVKH